MLCLNNKYQFNPQQPIGKGSSSRVYSGKNLQTNETVAIKQIDLDTIEEQFKRRITTEIDILIQLNHPNIVKIYDVISLNNDNINLASPNKNNAILGNSIYIIMEYCDGGDFDKLINSHKRLREGQARQYFFQLMKGLHYLREQKILHRDLKPANILLTHNKTILKIADFGFARKFAEEDLSQTFCGTPLYMAPELYTEGQYSSKSDLWSVGVMLYQSLFGKAPYADARNSIQLGSFLRTRPITFPKNIQVSNECLDLLVNLLQKDTLLRIGWVEFYQHSWWNKVVPDSALVALYNEKILQKQHIQVPIFKDISERTIGGKNPDTSSSDNSGKLIKYSELPDCLPTQALCAVTSAVAHELAKELQKEDIEDKDFVLLSRVKEAKGIEIYHDNSSNNSGLSISPLILQSYLQMRPVDPLSNSNPEFTLKVSSRDQNVKIIPEPEIKTERSQSLPKLEAKPADESNKKLDRENVSESYFWNLLSSVTNIWSRPSLSEL